MIPSFLVFLDEAGVRVGMNRLYGWAPVGDTPVISMEIRGTTLTMVGAMAADGPRGLAVFKGALDSDRLVEYIDDTLDLRAGEVLVMDGLSVHKTAAVKAAVERKGASVLILPPYSPELNPIELIWGILKARLRTQGAPDIEQLKDQVLATWAAIERHMFCGSVTHCGYRAAAST